jgi:hypothetical protein
MSKNGAAKKGRFDEPVDEAVTFSELPLDARHKRVADVLSRFSADIAADGKLKAEQFAKRQKNSQN